MTDAEKKNLADLIHEDFRRRLAANKWAQRIIREGAAASMDDVATLAKQLGYYLSASVAWQISAADLPFGSEEMEQLAHQILDPMLKENYDLINSAFDDAQRRLDEAHGINMEPKHAKYQQERADAICSSTADPTANPKTIRRRLAKAAETMTNAMSDRNMKDNADFRNKAGFKTYIVRTDDGNCCEWCAKNAGRYEYPDQTPKDVFRRHDNCGCKVIYENGTMRQNVHSKETWEQPYGGTPELVRNPDVNVPELTRNPEYRGKELYMGNSKALTASDESGIINIEIDELTPCLRDNKTGELVQTEVIRIADHSELSNCTEKKGWSFPWDKAPIDSDVYALKVKGSSEIEGLIALKKEPENAAVYLYWGNAAPHNRITESNTQKKYNGVGGHLFAIAADISVKEGYGGFIYADAANKDLYELFVNEYGATPIPTHTNPYRFFFDGKTTRKILDTYTFDWR